MKRAREEEEKVKGLSPKEREEYKRSHTRLSGAHLIISNELYIDEPVCF